MSLFASMMSATPPSTPASAPSAESAPAAEGGETPEQALESGGAEGGEIDPLTAEVSDEAEEAAEEAAAAALDDETEFDIDGEKVKGKELREGRLRQADYTKKTQAIAEERKQFKETLATVNEEKQELVDWVSSLSDPETLQFELKRNFRETYDNLRDMIIQEVFEEQDMTENEIRMKRRAEDAEFNDRVRKADEEYNRKKNERQEYNKKTTQLRETYNGWTNTAMEAAGLDPKSPKHQKLVRGFVLAEYSGQDWGEKHFQKAAEEVAKELGKFPAKKKADPKAAAAKLPPTKPQGNKAPAGTKAAPKQPQKKDHGSFFDNLRKQNGLA